MEYPACLVVPASSPQHGYDDAKEIVTMPDCKYLAITRAPGPELSGCVLTHLSRQTIDFARAHHQHRTYQDTLRRAGIHLIELPADPALPDGVFVEDTAVVLDDIAVIASPTPPSRRHEP